MTEEIIDVTPNELDCWFELSYAHYLTVPRRVLQEMPTEWQNRFAKCLFELDDTFDWRPDGCYWVKLKDRKGRYVSDPLDGYRHPTVPLKRLPPDK